jgi:hypothetical protein
MANTQYFEGSHGDTFKETFPCISLEENHKKSQSVQSLPWSGIEPAIHRMRRRETYMSF